MDSVRHCIYLISFLYIICKSITVMISHLPLTCRKISNTTYVAENVHFMSCCMSQLLLKLYISRLMNNQCLQMYNYYLYQVVKLLMHEHNFVSQAIYIHVHENEFKGTSLLHKLLYIKYICVCIMYFYIMHMVNEY